jgi:broad specificity phosphatase PhoE
LKEYDIGIFSKLTWDEICAKYPEVAQEFQKSRDWGIVEGAEPLRSRRNRARRVIDAVIERHANDDAVLMFTHGGILQFMLATLMGTEHTSEMPVGNTAIFDFTLDIERRPLSGGGLQNNFLWSVVHFNDTSHLT